MRTLEEALRIAIKENMDKTTKGGKRHLLHPQSLEMHSAGEDVKHAAERHNVSEDTEKTGGIEKG